MLVNSKQISTVFGGVKATSSRQAMQAMRSGAAHLINTKVSESNRGKGLPLLQHGTPLLRSCGFLVRQSLLQASQGTWPMARHAAAK